MSIDSDERHVGEIMPRETEDAQRAEIEARLEMVAARTSQALSESDRKMVRGQIARALELRGALRTVALENHDAPEDGFDPADREPPTRQDRRR